jgi:DNA-binding transcriptional MocR family regulator
VAAAYRARRDALLTELAARGIEAHGESGLNVWVPVPDETSALAALVQRGWVAAPGARYRIQSPPGLRFTVSRMEDSQARELAEDLAAVLGAGEGGSRLV